MTGDPQGGVRHVRSSANAVAATEGSSRHVRGTGGGDVLKAARPASRRVPGRGMLGGFVAVSLWGLAPVVTRALVSHAAPLPVVTLRLLLAACVLLPWAIPVFRRLGPRSLMRLVVAGALGMIGYNLPVTIGLQWLPASTAGLLLATEPLWVLAITGAFLAEHVAPRAWFGSAVALIGVAVIAGPAALSPGNGWRSVAGAGLALLATLAFGGYTIVMRPLSETYGAVPATAASTVVGALPYLAFAGTLSPTRLARMSSAGWGELLFLALGSTVIGMLLWNRAVLRAAAPGSAACCTSSRWSACWARWPPSERSLRQPSWPAAYWSSSACS